MRRERRNISGDVVPRPVTSGRVEVRLSAAVPAEPIVRRRRRIARPNISVARARAAVPRSSARGSRRLADVAAPGLHRGTAPAARSRLPTRPFLVSRPADVGQTADRAVLGAERQGCARPRPGRTDVVALGPSDAGFRVIAIDLLPAGLRRLRLKRRRFVRFSPRANAFRCRTSAVTPPSPSMCSNT